MLDSAATGGVRPRTVSAHLQLHPVAAVILLLLSACAVGSARSGDSAVTGWAIGHGRIAACACDDPNTDCVVVKGGSLTQTGEEAWGVFVSGAVALVTKLVAF